MTWSKHARSVRPVVDAGMAVAYLAQMMPGKMGNVYHEFAGIALAALFVAHHLLNRGWVRHLSRRPGLVPRLMLISDVVLLVCMVGAAVTGVLMSRSALPMLAAPGVAHIVRPLHGACTYLGLMLVAFHAGLHMPVLRAYAGLHATKSRLDRWVFAAGMALAVSGGVWAAVRLNVATILLGGPSFPDAVTPAWLQLVEHVLFACPFALLGAWVEDNRRSGRDKEGD